MCNTSALHLLWLLIGLIIIFLLPSFLYRRNIPRSSTGSFLHSCSFNETEIGQTCPIFTLKQIVDMYSDKEGMYDELATKVL